MRQAYTARRELVTGTLRRYGFEFTAPEGAFYVFARVPDPDEGGDRFCERMLADHGLGVREGFRGVVPAMLRRADPGA